MQLVHGQQIKVVAKATTWGLGFSSTNKEQVAVSFRFMDQDNRESHITWFGFFTEAAADRTIESLRICGWRGVDLADLTGLDQNEVELIIEGEEYEGKVQARVRWINRLGGGLTLKQPMSDAEKIAFARRMKGAVLAYDKTKGGGQKKSGAPPPRAASSGPVGPEPPPVADDDYPDF